MIDDPQERPQEFHIEITPREEPPKLGFLLTFLAIGLALFPARALRSLMQLNSTPDTAGYLGVSAVVMLATGVWAYLNLYWLIKRRKAFLKSMTAMFGTVVIAAMVVIAGQVPFATSQAQEALWVNLIGGVAVPLLWITYLARSKHVRKVFVR